MNVFWPEYRRYEGVLASTLEQLSDDAIFHEIDGTNNSVATIVYHLSGNFRSRFTDFLTTDGEKPWRDRDSEFEIGNLSRAELSEKWSAAWSVLESSVRGLGPQDMERVVKIRGVELTVEEALARSLAHFAYHVGQVVLLAKHFQGAEWRYLSIAPGKSAEYNQNPTLEKGNPGSA